MTGHAPGPWEYNDPKEFTQGHGRFSETAVYAAGNAFPWRMAEIQGPNEQVEIATARLIAAAPDMYDALSLILQYFEDHGSTIPSSYIEHAYAAIDKAEGK